jgi:hypothetical protein
MNLFYMELEMEISCQTEDGTLYLLKLDSLETLSEFLTLYSATNYNLQINQVGYQLVKIRRCAKQEYPKITLERDNYILPTELTLTQLSDLQYFLSKHSGSLYYLEIASCVYQISKSK